MNATTYLEIIAIVIAALKAVPGVDPQVQAYIEVGDDAFNRALAAHKEAQASVDPSKLHQIEPLA